MKLSSSRFQVPSTVKRRKTGYVLLEIVIALGLFSAVAVSLVKALHMTSRTAVLIQEEMQIERRR